MASRMSVSDQVGSSPPTRGTRAVDGQHLQLPRFIPAYAGNTSRAPCRRARAAVHPRLRGEHRKRWGWINETNGSSPPTRGTRVPLLSSNVPTRFIPAYAGNTSLARTEDASIPVHPRLRGEHLSTTAYKMGTTGSSPPTRGTQMNV